MDIFEIIGLVVVVVLAIYLALYFYYDKIKEEALKVGSQITMPVLRPIPIPTKTQSTLWVKIAVGIFEVRRWELRENWHYTLKNGDEIVIPKGFDFDGASIPRVFWAFLSPTGLLLIPGLVHDYGYKYNQLWKLDPAKGVIAYPNEKADKPYWDNLFREIGKEVNNFSFINFVAWLAVTLGGSRAWNEHRAANAKPDKPVV